MTKGANLPRLDAESFDSIEIPLPALSEQQRIVEILQKAEQIRRLRASAEARTAALIPALFAAQFGHPVDNPRRLGGLFCRKPDSGHTEERTLQAIISLWIRNSYYTYQRFLCRKASEPFQPPKT